MNFLFKKNYYCLAKFYVVPGSNWHLNFMKIMAEYKEYFSLNLSVYSLNYSKEKKIGLEKLRAVLERCGIDNLEHFSYQTEVGVQGVTITEPFKYLTLQERVYEFLFVAGGDNDLEGFFSYLCQSLIRNQIDVRYGYARKVLESIDPGTENKIRKNILGSVSVEMSDPKSTWVDDPSQVVHGGIKEYFKYSLIAPECTNPKLFELGKVVSHIGRMKLMKIEKGI